MQALLHTPASPDTMVFRKRFAYAAEPLIAGHRIAGHGILPAAAQVEMALAAARHLSDGRCFRLRDVVFLAPLVIAPGDEATVALEVTPQEDGYRFQLLAEGPERRELCRGRVAALPGAPPEWCSLAALRERIHRRVDGESIRAWYEGCGIEYGPALRTLRDYTQGAGEALYLLHQPEHQGPFVLDPTVLDGALQGLGVWLEHGAAREASGDTARAAPYLPYYLGRMEVLAPLDGPVWCHATALRREGSDDELLRGDLTLLDAQGQVRVRLEGVTLKRLPAPAAEHAQDSVLEPAAPAGATNPSTVTAALDPELAGYFHELRWQPAAAPDAQHLPEGDWLILAPPHAVVDELVRELEAHGRRCTVVRDGTALRALGEDRFELDAARWSDYPELLRQAGGVERFSVLVHARALREGGGGLMDLTGSLVALAQAVGAELRRDLRLLVVTAGAQAVGGDGVADPTAAALWGAGRTIPQEYRRLRTTCVDLPATEESAEENAAELARVLLAEADDAEPETATAWRGGRRWRPELVARTSPPAGPRWRVRPGGSYLITGGMGDLGLVVAAWLAQRGAGRLILANRGDYRAAVEQVRRREAAPSELNPHQRQTLGELFAKGVSIETRCLDVGDAYALGLALSEMGELHGVVHCAGVLRDGLIRGKSPRDLEAVLAPKAQAATTLVRALGGRDVDFLLLFSSLSGVLGNLGQVDYAAANAYLDGLASAAFAAGQRVSSLAWGPWRGLGMLAQETAGGGNVHGFETIDAALGRRLLDAALEQPAPHHVLFRRARPTVASAQPSAVQPFPAAPSPAPTPAPSPAALFEANRGAVAAGAEIVVSSATVPPAPAADLHGALVEVLVRELGTAFGVDPGVVKADTDLLAMGLTSLMVIEVKAALETGDLDLDPALFFRFSTPDELASHLLEAHPVAMAALVGETAAPETATKAMAAAGEVTGAHLEPSRIEMSRIELPELELPEFLRRRIDELSAEDVASKERGDYFYEPVIRELDGPWVDIGDRRMLMLASYSYLDLIGHPKIDAAAKQAVDRFGTGTHGVRLLAGTNTLHRELEETIARFKHAEDAVVYSSGFITNVTTVSALVRKGDVVIGDMFNHASIVDGCMQSGARFMIFGHNDMADLERCLVKAGDAGKLVVVDAVFSMDGDIIDLPEVVRLCRRYGAALMVDEAHSVGVLGTTGRGIEEHFGLPTGAVDVKMGTLSKTIPSVGGYVAGKRELIFALKNNARAFIFSAALPPAQAAAARAAFEVILEEPERIERLRRNVRRYRQGLFERGLTTTGGETAVLPVICQTAEQAIAMARFCQQRNIFVQPIVYPAVPVNAPRLRTIITAAHTDADIGLVLDTLTEAGRAHGLLAPAPVRLRSV